MDKGKVAGVVSLILDYNKIKVFRKSIGLLPKEYRNMARK